MSLKQDFSMRHGAVTGVHFVRCTAQAYIECRTQPTACVSCAWRLLIPHNTEKTTKTHQEHCCACALAGCTHTVGGGVYQPPVWFACECRHVVVVQVSSRQWKRLCTHRIAVASEQTHQTQRPTQHKHRPISRKFGKVATRSEGNALCFGNALPMIC